MRRMCPHLAGTDPLHKGFCPRARLHLLFRSPLLLPPLLPQKGHRTPPWMLRLLESSQCPAKDTLGVSCDAMLYLFSHLAWGCIASKARHPHINEPSPSSQSLISFPLKYVTSVTHGRRCSATSLDIADVRTWP